MILTELVRTKPAAMARKTTARMTNPMCGSGWFAFSKDSTDARTAACSAAVLETTRCCAPCYSPVLLARVRLPLGDDEQLLLCPALLEQLDRPLELHVFGQLAPLGRRVPV